MRISDWSSDVCSSDLYPRPARLARPEQQCHRAIQGRNPLSPERHRKRAQIPGVRADVQERADRAADGRRQGWVELQSEGQERARDHALRSEEHTSELQSLMRISYAVCCLKKKNKNQ